MAKEEDKIQVEGEIIEALPEPSSACVSRMAMKYSLIYPAACAGITFVSCSATMSKLK